MIWTVFSSDIGFTLFHAFPVSYFNNMCLLSSPALNVSVSLPPALCFPPVSYLTFPVCASCIVGMQMWVCKCYGKRRSRCVAARTESGQPGRADMPCMQFKSVYNMAPRGHHTRGSKLNGCILNSSPWHEWEGPPLSVSQSRSRRENCASHEGLYSFIFVRIPLAQTTCQAWQWTEFKRWAKLRTKMFSPPPGLLKVARVWGCLVFAGNVSSWPRHGSAIRKRNPLQLQRLNWWPS